MQLRSLQTQDCVESRNVLSGVELDARVNAGLAHAGALDRKVELTRSPVAHRVARGIRHQLRPVGDDKLRSASIETFHQPGEATAAAVRSTLKRYVMADNSG